MIRIGAGIIIVLLISLSIYLGRCVWLANQEWRKGENQFQNAVLFEKILEQQNLIFIGPNPKNTIRPIPLSIKSYFLKESIRHLKRSLDWFVYKKESQNLMLQIGELSEKHNNIPLALLAYRDLRSSLYGSRSFFQPKKKLINVLNQKIIHLMEGTVEQKKVWLSEMERPNRVSVLWAWNASIGFIVWIFSVFVLIFEGFEGDGQIVKFSKSKGILAYFIISVLTMVFWLFSLSRVS